MMKYVYLLVICILLFSCNKDEDLNCDTLTTALMDRDFDAIVEELQPTLDNFSPEPAAGDPIGHRANFEALLQLFESECSGFDALMTCYACIFTLPAQTEVWILFSDDNVVALDISTPDDGPLELVDIH